MSASGDYIKPQSFAELAELRGGLVVANKRNNTFDGLMQFVSELYPDTAHFVYELLQNAEDAGATHAEFELGADQVRFRHDGTRAFSLEDVEAITNIGTSTKKEDLTAIGKFGVGFKAVFSYCTAPEIYSSKYSFRIENLFVPVALENSHRDDWTRFVFRFDHPSKPARRAFSEVGAGLDAIEDSSLLFLTNLSSIRFKVGGGDWTALDRTQMADGTVQVCRSHGGRTNFSHWLVYRGASEPDPSRSRSSYTDVAIACAIAEKAAPSTKVRPLPGPTRSPRTAPERQFQLVPLDDAAVHVYFPAAKERSGLKFLVHAPFATTAARDSLVASEHNEALVKQLSSLASGSLHDLRKRGLLSTDALACMPNSQDDISPSFEPVRQAVLAAFNEEPLTPVVRGGHAPACTLYRSSGSIRLHLTTEDLAYLVRGLDDEPPESPNWVGSPKGRPGAFLESLAVREFGFEELDSAIGDLSGESWSFGYSGRDRARLEAARELWGRWLLTLPDEKLRGIYVLLGEGYETGDLTPQGLPIVRCGVEGQIAHVHPSEASLPPRRGARRANFVVPALCPDPAQKNADQRHLAAFFDSLGVDVWTETHDLLERLTKWSEDFSAATVSVSAEHLEDVRELVERLEQGELGEDVQAELRRTPFLLAEDSTRHSILMSTPSNLLVPSEFTGLPIEQVMPNKPLLWRGYAAALGLGARALEKLGAQCSLRVSKWSATWNPEFRNEWRAVGRASDYFLDHDYRIDELESIVELDDERLWIALWDLVRTRPPMMKFAEYRLNRTASHHRFESQLFQQLGSAAWVLCSDGVARRPRDVEWSELDKRLRLPSGPSLIAEVSFGTAALEREQLQRFRNSTASRLGFSSAEEAVEAAKMLGDPVGRQVFEAYFAAQAAREFDEPPANPERRAAVATERAREASTKTYVTRERSVRLGDSDRRQQAKTYLRSRYGSADISCQMCACAMPFTIGGNAYFEAVELVGDLELEVDAAYVALCPNCSARLRHAKETDDSDLRNAVVAWPTDSGAREHDLQLSAGGESFDVLFDARHAIDLKAAIIFDEASGSSEEG